MFEHLVKSWITTLAGITIYIITSLLIWKGNFDILWEGVGGYCLGTLLIIAPQTIEKFVEKWMDNKKQDPNGQ